MSLATPRTSTRYYSAAELRQNYGGGIEASADSGGRPDLMGASE